MPRRRVLTPAERLSLLAIPATDDERMRHYTLSEADVTVSHQHRGRHNRLGLVMWTVELTLGHDIGALTHARCT